MSSKCHWRGTKTLCRVFVNNKSVFTRKINLISRWDIDGRSFGFSLDLNKLRIQKKSELDIKLRGIPVSIKNRGKDNNFLSDLNIVITGVEGNKNQSLEFMPLVNKGLKILTKEFSIFISLDGIVSLYSKGLKNEFPLNKKGKLYVFESESWEMSDMPEI